MHPPGQPLLHPTEVGPDFIYGEQPQGKELLGAVSSRCCSRMLVWLVQSHTRSALVVLSKVGWEAFWVSRGLKDYFFF